MNMMTQLYLDGRPVLGNAILSGDHESPEELGTR